MSNEVAVVGNGMVCRNLVSRKGKVVGTETRFTATGSAKDIREALKEKGLTGAKLKDGVNSVLRGEIDLRTQLGVAWLQASYAEGLVPDVGTLRKNSASLRLVRVGDDSAKLAKLAADKAAKEIEAANGQVAKLMALLSAKGLSGEEIASVLNAE